MGCAPPFRPSRPSPRWTRLGRTLLGKGPKWSPKGTQLGGQAKGAGQPLSNPSRPLYKEERGGGAGHPWAPPHRTLAAPLLHPSPSCAPPLPGGLPPPRSRLLAAPPLAQRGCCTSLSSSPSCLAWRSPARGRSPPSTPPQPSWCRDLSSHSLLACGIKKAESTSSRTCGYRGGAAHAVLHRIGSHG